MKEQMEDLVKRQALIINYLRNKLTILQHEVVDYDLAGQNLVEEITKILEHVNLITNSLVSMEEYEKKMDEARKEIFKLAENPLRE